MRQLYSQLPEDYLEFHHKLSLSKKAWQLFGLSYGDICQMDDYDLAMLEITING